MAITDHGIRVWVDDDQLIIHKWQGQAAMSVYLDHALRYARPVRVGSFDTEDEATTTVHWAVKT